MKPALLAIVVWMIGASAAWAEIKTEPVEYQHGSAQLRGYIVYDDALQGERPGVMIVHEWWGLNDFVLGRAREVAQLGYVAFAADMYGKGVVAQNREEAAKLAGGVRNDPAVMRSRAQAGLEVLKKHDRVDASRVAAMGYCFGGTTVLELARSGADLAGVISFHGTLSPQGGSSKAGSMRAKILVLHGAADGHVPDEQVLAFMKEMRDANANWQLNIYSAAKHSFTNPDADKAGMPSVGYDPQADRRSWEAMRSFLQELLRAGRAG